MALDSAWSFYDPLGNCSADSNGNQASIGIPAGAAHDLWTGALNAPRITQLSGNTDFELSTKIDSPMTIQYQSAGIIVEQDHNNFIRFDFFSDGSKIRAFCASFVAGTPTTRLNQIINGLTTPIYLHVQRVGNVWTFWYSANGTTWTQLVTFNHTLTVANAGLWAGTAGTNPAFTALFDYYFVDEPMIGRQATLIGSEEPDYSVSQAGVTVAGDVMAIEYSADSSTDDMICLASALVSGVLTASPSAPDTFWASGQTKVIGNLLATGPADTMIAQAFVSSSGNRVGSLLATGPADSCVATASVQIGGTLSATEDLADSSVIDADAQVQSTVNAIDPSDTMSALAQAIASGDLAMIGLLEDTAVIVAKSLITATLNGIPPAPDSCSAAAKAIVTGNLVGQEPQDQCIAFAVRHATGNLVGIEPQYAMISQGQVSVVGTLNAVEPTAQANITGIVRWPDIVGVMNASGPQDSMISEAKVSIQANASAAPAADSAEIIAQNLIAGLLSAPETFPDTADIWIENPVTGTLVGIANNDTLIANGIVRWPDIHGQMNATPTPDHAEIFAQALVTGLLLAEEIQDDSDIDAKVSIEGQLNAVEIIPPAQIKMRKNQGWLAGIIEIKPAVNAEIVVNDVID